MQTTLAVRSPMMSSNAFDLMRSAFVRVSGALAVLALVAGGINYAFTLYSNQPISALSAVLLSIPLACFAVAVHRRPDWFPSAIIAGATLVSAGLGLVNFVRPELQPFAKKAPLWAQTINLTLERNLPTFFSSYLLCMVALSALGCYWAERGAGNERFARERVLWLLVAIGFLFLAVDETLMVHEALNDFLRQRITVEALNRNYWTLIYLPLGVVGLLAFGPFIYRRFTGDYDRALPFIAAIVLWGCVPMLEVAGVTIFRGAVSYYKNASILEEVFEMGGSLAFMTAFVRHVKFASTSSSAP